MCEHKWVLMDTKKYSEYNGFTSLFTKVYMFYCEKCAETLEKNKQDYSREAPDWY